MSEKGRANFRLTAPWVMTLLMEDFDFSLEDAAAICGNGGHESDGLRAINEINPTVKGSRGGFSWFQWTGPRRVEFEKYCARNNLSPSSDKAAYNWLFIELKGSEKAAVEATKEADTLEAKVEAFEKHFERAGVKHYPSRVDWAKRALEAYEAATETQRIAPWLRGIQPAPQASTVDVGTRQGSVGAPAPLPAPETAPPVPVSTVEPGTPVIVGTGGKVVPVGQDGKPLDPNQGTSPVEKVIGAGKGAVIGGVGSMTFGAALVYLADFAGYIPDNANTAMLGLAVGTILSSVTTGISSMIGTYMAKRNL